MSLLVEWSCQVTSELATHWDNITQLTTLTFLSLTGAHSSFQCISQLQHLPRLHEFTMYRCSAFDLPQALATRLQCLTLYDCAHQVCDLAACVHVTSLDFGAGSVDLQILLLPAGDHVQLRELAVVNCKPQGVRLLTFHIHNLHVATRLELFHLNTVKPVSWFGDMQLEDWLVSLPNLRCINVAGVPVSPPAHVFAGYSRLRELSWQNVPPGLPECFSELTQLSSLSLKKSSFTAIPPVIMALTNLCCLDLSRNAAVLEVTEDVIAQLVTWPHLSRLYLGSSQHAPPYGTDAQLGMIQLCSMMKPKCHVEFARA